MDWAELFERAERYETDVDAIRETLDDHRSADRDDAEEDEHA